MKPKYEWLRVRSLLSDEYILDDEGNYLSYTDDIPDGWYKAFGEQMIDELNELLVKYNFVNKYRIIQIKEKFAQLRWYDNGVPEEASLEYWQWLDKYERLSEETCTKCGDKSTHFSTGWITPLCDRCGSK